MRYFGESKKELSNHIRGKKREKKLTEAQHHDFVDNLPRVLLKFYQLPM